MKDKKITLTLVDLRVRYPDDQKPFRIRSVTNSVQFKVNDYLKVEEVQDLLFNRSDVEIKLVIE